MIIPPRMENFVLPGLRHRLNQFQSQAAERSEQRTNLATLALLLVNDLKMTSNWHIWAVVAVWFKLEPKPQCNTLLPSEVQFLLEKSGDLQYIISQLGQETETDKALALAVVAHLTAGQKNSVLEQKLIDAINERNPMLTLSRGLDNYLQSVYADVCG